jgi:hypothetical protein
MSLLLSDSNLRKHVENRFTFNFQLPCQIVNSNLAHPPSLASAVPLSLHINLTASVFSSALPVSRERVKLHLLLVFLLVFLRILGRSRLLPGYFGLRGCLVPRGFRRHDFGCSFHTPG